MAGLRSTRTWSVAVLVAGLALLAATAYAVIGARTGTVGFRDAFGMLRWIVQAGIVALVFAAGALVATFVTRDASGRGLALLAVLLLAVPVGGVLLNRQSPPAGAPINDITTDLEDPPAFDAVVSLRPADSNPVEYGGEAVAVRQREAHPEVKPILTAMPPDQAFARALATAEGMGWDIVAQDAATGIIEAIDTTTFFGFKDDIVVRVRPAPEGSRVDLRSRSRVGRSDLGKNAARIVEYSEAFTRG